MFLSIFQKSSILFLTTAILLPSFVVPQAKAISVTGFVTVISQPNVEGLLAQIATATTAETALDTKEFSLKVLTEILKKRLLDEMVDDVIQWIQNGEEPRFVTDWNDFLDEAANIAVGDFAEELGLGFLCQPFSAQLQIALFPERRFSHAISCTLDDIVSNLDGFYDNFSDGGWLAYQTAWEPQNNIFGAFLMADEEKDRQINRAKFNSYSDAMASNGFLSTYTCKEKGDITNPASGRDIDEDGDYGDYGCTVATPGSIVGDLAKDAVGVDFDYIVNADDLSEYLSAITNALINRLIREGVDGLRGLSSNDNPQEDFEAPAKDPCAALSGDTRIICDAYFTTHQDTSTAVRNNYFSILREAKNVREDYLGILSEELDLWSAYLQYLWDNQDSNFCITIDKFTYPQLQIASIENQVDLINATIPLIDQAISDFENNYSAASLTRIIGTLQAQSPGVFDVVQMQDEILNKESDLSNLQNSINTLKGELSTCTN